MLETQDLKDFSIRSWYHQFKEISIETVLIDIPPELLGILRSNVVQSDVEEVCNENYLNRIISVIKSFRGNIAFIKNNWHAPMDAKFISFGNSLQVTCIDDLILYFTASDIIINDFASNKFDDFCIAFKPWLNLHPAAEFRCIVVNNILRGITPRDWPTFYAHYLEEGRNIIKIISSFFVDKIQSKFCRKHYIFDVVINCPEDVMLVDFGPLNNKSNLYAFSWNEIQSILKKNCSLEVAPVFRYLESDLGIMTKADAVCKINTSFA